jgi:hypothetical protein
MKDFLEKLNLQNIFEGVLGNAIFYVVLSVVTVAVGVLVWMIVRPFKRSIFIRGIHGWNLSRRTATEPTGIQVISIWPPNSLLFDFTLEVQNDSEDYATLTNTHVLFKHGAQVVGDCEVDLGNFGIAAKSRNSIPISCGLAPGELTRYDAVNSIWFQARVSESERLIRRRIVKGRLPERQTLPVVA